MFTFNVTGIPAGNYKTFVTYANGTTSAESEVAFDGTDTVRVQAGTSLTIKGLTTGTTVQVQETGYDGYAPSWNTSASSTVNHSDTAEAAVVSASVVTIYFTNTTGAALPNTGGVGTSIYTLLGSMMMLSAGVLLMIHRRRREAT